jgi:hypothetical protein
LLLVSALAGCADDAAVLPSPESGIRASADPIDPWGPQPPYIPEPELIPIYRWWKYGDHLFGVSPDEGYAHGYVLEHSPSFYLYDSGPSYQYVQIFRCWRHNALNQHFMTTSPTCDGEANVTREDRDGGFARRPAYAYGGMVPLYRLRYPPNGDDLVTISESEKNDIIAAGWEYLGILGYVYP